MNVWYMAHPVAGNVPANLAAAKRWLRWLNQSTPDDVVVIAPWIPYCEAVGDDTDPAQRQLGLLGDCEVVSRCDAIVLVGGRVSAGMALEAGVAKEIRDLTSLGAEPPTPEVGL